MPFLLEQTEPQCLSVSQLNKQARLLLEGHFGTVFVEGEISNFRPYSSGHWYFSLKDNEAQVRCAMFKGANQYVRFNVTDGMHLKVQATVSLYEGRGDYQLIVRSMEPAGEGALQKAFESLKKKLHAEGLFAEANKQPIPPFITHLGIITSKNAAALRDILTTLKRRSIGQRITIYPCEVQGKTAAASITKMIHAAIEDNRCQTLLLARGGGSLEDLFCFNDEALARAIYACPIPIISGVGHEIDFTIADFVADLRAATPTAAAELASPDPEEIRQRIISFRRHLHHSTLERLRHQSATLKQHQLKLQHFRSGLKEYVFKIDRVHRILSQAMQTRLKSLRHRLHQDHTRLIRLKPSLRKNQNRLQMAQRRLQKAFEMHLKQHENKLSRLSSRLKPSQLMIGQHQLKLQAHRNRLGFAIVQTIQVRKNQLKLKSEVLLQLGPMKALEKGYSIVRDASGRIVNNAHQLSLGDGIELKFYQGSVHATVDSVSD